MRFVIASVLAAALAAGAAAPALAQVNGQSVISRAYTVEPFTPPTQITIQGEGVRLRAEPFATRETQVLSSGSTGLQLTVVGISRQPDWNWYQVILKNGQKAFIRSDLTSAPSRGGSALSVVQPAQPTQPPVLQPAPQPTPLPPQVALTPPPQPVQPRPIQPQPAQPLPPIPSQPLGTGGAISLTPSGPVPQLPPATSAPVDSGLLSVSPTPPAPRFSNPAPAPIALAPVTMTPAPVAVPRATSTAPAGLAQNIRAQLDTRRCWTDSSSMMDAHRLKATFAVTFAPSGKFAGEPRLIEPAAEPSNDPAMMVFLAKARAAMRTCNAMGFDVPMDYFSNGPGDVHLDFSAR